MAVSFDPKQETNDIGTSNSGTSNSAFSSIELEIGPIISFKVISWYQVTLLLRSRATVSLFHKFDVTDSRQ